MAEEKKAISSHKVYLCTTDKDAGTFTKLIDIKDFPDIGGTPEMLDCTTTSDATQCFINGIQMLDNNGLEFTANYTKDNYNKVKGKDKTAGWYAVVFAGEETTSGSDTTITNKEGAFYFEGTLVAYPKGAAVNSIVDLAISIVPSSEIKYKAPTA